MATCSSILAWEILWTVAKLCPTLRPDRLKHARLPSPSLSPGGLLKLMSIESVMPSNHLILCLPLLLLLSIFPSINIFSNKLVLHIGWPKYWNFSFSITPSNTFLPGEFHEQRSLVGYSP